MRTQQDLEAALAQFKRSIADLTDDHIAIFRDRKGDDFADRVEQARTRHRLGADYQARVEAAQVEANYAADCRRRQQLDTINQRAAGFRGMGEPRPVQPKRNVVRIMTAEERQQLQDRARGIVRLDPRRR